MKKSFIIYSDFKATLDKLPNEDAGKLFKMILDFVNGIDTNPESLILDVAFAPIKQQIQDQIDKQKIKSDKMKSNGSLGGKAKAKVLAKANKSYQKLPIAKTGYKKWTTKEFIEDINTNKKEYPSDMLKAFYNYWTEKNSQGVMRFQLQKTWETSKRLLTWSKNNFNNSPVNNSSNDYNNSTVKNLKSWNK